MMSLHFFATTDLTPQAVPETEWRDSLMRMFFRGISHDGMDDFGPDLPRRDFCDGWRGVTCLKQSVRNIKYDGNEYGSFNIGALPNTVWIIEINRCAQSMAIVTRRFPVSLKKVDLSFNRYHGALNLTTLPAHLEEAHFQKNQLCGGLFLSNLPHCFRILDVSSNHYFLDTVYYDTIPPSAGRICLSQTEGRPQVHSVRALYSASKVLDKSIFVGVKRSNVH